MALETQSQNEDEAQGREASELHELLSAVVDRLQERQSIMQQAFYRDSRLANELRAMILLDLTVVMRDALNDVKGSR
jgi:hypothetical protein